MFIFLADDVKADTSCPDANANLLSTTCVDINAELYIRIVHLYCRFYVIRFAYAVNDYLLLRGKSITGEFIVYFNVS